MRASTGVIRFPKRWWVWWIACHDALQALSTSGNRASLLLAPPPPSLPLHLHRADITSIFPHPFCLPCCVQEDSQGPQPGYLLEQNCGLLWEGWCVRWSGSMGEKGKKAGKTGMWDCTMFMSCSPCMLKALSLPDFIYHLCIWTAHLCPTGNHWSFDLFPIPQQMAEFMAWIEQSKSCYCLHHPGSLGSWEGQGRDLGGGGTWPQQQDLGSSSTAPSSAECLQVGRGSIGGGHTAVSPFLFPLE